MRHFPHNTPTSWGGRTVRTVENDFDGVATQIETETDTGCIAEYDHAGVETTLLALGTFRVDGLTNRRVTSSLRLAA